MQYSLIVLLIMLAAGITRSQPNRNVRFVAEALVSGDFQDVKVIGERIFCANTYGVIIYTYDDENPEQPPVQIARFPTPGQANALFIDDTLCYVADGSRGLRIYDISDLNAVEEIGVWEEEVGFVGIEVRDSIAYLISDRIGIYSIDLNVVTNPTLLCFFEFNIRDTKRMFLRGDYLWTIQMSTFYLTALDISNPREINIGGQFEGSRSGFLFSLHEDIAFIPSDTMKVLDVSNPENIQVISTFHHRNFVGAIYNNGYLYGDIGTYFSITDIRELENIRLLGFLISQGSLESTGLIDFRGDYVLAPASKRGLKIVNVADKEDPFIQHVNHTNAWIRDVAYRDNIVFAADGQTGVWPAPRIENYYFNGRLRVFSVADPAMPVQIAEVDSILNRYDYGFGNITVFRDSLVCLGGYGCGLTIFNVIEPEHPQHIFGSGPNGRQLSSGRFPTYYEDLLFVASGTTLWINSLENPDNPERLVTYQNDEVNRFYKIFPEDFYLLITGQVFGQFPGVVTYDWSDLDNIQRVGEWEQLSGGLKATGVRYMDYLYLIGGLGGSGMSVVNIEDPLHPQEVYYTDEVIKGVEAAVIRNCLFVANAEHGVQIFDLDNPEHPQQVGYYDTPHFASGMDVDAERGFLYVADLSDLSVYDVGELLGVWDLSISAEFLDFGGVEMGDSLSDTLFIANHAQEVIAIDSLRVSGGVFSVGDYDGTELQPDEELALPITFRPDTVGTYDGRLDVYSQQRQLTAALTGEGTPLGVTEQPGLPRAFKLFMPYPNPFNASITIRYDVAERTRASLEVFDLSGRSVATLHKGVAEPGRHTAAWNAESAPAGLYFVRLNAGGKVFCEKIMLVK